MMQNLSKHSNIHGQIYSNKTWLQYCGNIFRKPIRVTWKHYRPLLHATGDSTSNFSLHYLNYLLHVLRWAYQPRNAQRISIRYCLLETYPYYKATLSRYSQSGHARFLCANIMAVFRKPTLCLLFRLKDYK